MIRGNLAYVLEEYEEVAPPFVPPTTSTQADAVGSDLRRFLLLQGLFWFLALCTEAVCRFFLHWGLPFNTPLFGGLEDRCPDFTQWSDDVFHRFHHLGFFYPVEGWHKYSYPAAAALVYEPFQIFGRFALAMFLMTAVATFLLLAALVGFALCRAGVSRRLVAFGAIVAVCLAFPLWFDLQRGNIEVLIWAITAVGIWAVFTDKPYLAAFTFALAGSMKIYPFAFFLLLVRQRHFKAISAGLLFTVFLNLFALWAIYPNIAVSFHQSVVSMQRFQGDYVQAKGNVGFDHSLFGLFKRTVQLKPLGLSKAAGLYTKVGFAAFALLCLVWLRKLPMVNLVVALCVATILIPPVSYEYTLLQMYTVLAVLLLTTGTSRLRRWAVPILALLLSPMTEFILHHVTVEGQIKAVLLVLLLGIIHKFPVPESVLGTHIPDAM